jgi:excinuclease ABC subunit A
MEKPDVDVIEGLSPAISIEQKATSHNPRSTVGTVTEIYDYMRLMFARVGEPRCPDHNIALKSQTVSQMVDLVMALPEGSKVLLLAPMIDNRKGEYVQLMDNLYAQGFVRARIDGEVIDLSEPPKLEKNIKHSIQVVVDRLVVREGAQQRMAESFETALELAEDTAQVAILPNDEGEEEQIMVFSAKYACSKCGYSLKELEPRLFSFNNPVGACSSCDGLGVKKFFDPEEIIFDKELNVAAGAVRGWDKRHTYYYQMLQCVADHYGFDLELPFEDIPEAMQQIILKGSGNEEITFVYHRPGRKPFEKESTWEGILGNMERRYHETESMAVRDELSKFINTQSCPDCEGSRLSVGPRNVFIGNKAIHEVTALSISETFDFFSGLKLTGARLQIAEKILKEVNDRIGFLINVGMKYLR